MKGDPVPRTAIRDRHKDRSAPENEGFSVIYPTRDRPELLLRSVKTLLHNTVLPDEILIVDQSRTDATRRALASLAHPRVIHIPSGETGLSRARNAGIRASRYPLVGFLDDDCIPAENWVQAGLEAVRRFPESSVWTGKIFWLDTAHSNSVPTEARENHFTLKGYHDPWGLDFGGGNALFRKAAFDTVGLFDPLLGQGSRFPGAEDGDMFYRVLKHPLEIAYSNTIRCTHLGWRSGEENIGNAYNYGLGVGAMFAKYAHDGDYYPLGVIFPCRFLSRYFALPYNLLIGRMQKFRIHLKWVQGITDGFLGWRRMQRLAEK